MAKSSYKVESGIQLLARLNKKPTVFFFYPELFQLGLKPGEVVEFIYNEDTPRCLLNDIISTALMPSHYGGTGTGVLIFNCGGSFNYESLVTSMAKKFMFYTKTNNETEIMDIVEKQLHNLFLVEIHDATQYYTTIYNLENVLLEHPNITMILFNTITAFYWSEQGFKIMRMDTYLRKNLSIIQNVTKEHRVIVFFSKPHYFYSSKDAANNLDACNESSDVDGVNYRISVSYDKDCMYLANIKSSNMQQQKRFCVIQDEIKWL